MRRGFTLVLVTLAVAGCGADDADREAAPSSSSSSTASSSSGTRSSSAAPAETSAPPTLSAEMTERIFVNVLTDRGFIPEYATSDAAVQLAGALCDRYDAGASYEDVVAVLLGGGVPPYEAGGFEGAAVTAFCPEHVEKRTG